MRYSFSTFLILTFSLPFNYADHDEDEFLEVFGNDNKTSGIWQAVRDISLDESKMKSLCEQAHRRLDLQKEDKIERIVFKTKTLTFHNYNETTKRRPMALDVVTYGVERLPLNAFHFTKGRKPDCVYYLIQWDTKQEIFRVGLEYCNITIPAP